MLLDRIKHSSQLLQIEIPWVHEDAQMMEDVMPTVGVIDKIWLKSCMMNWRVFIVTLLLLVRLPVYYYLNFIHL
jgi:hypothetical protein